MGASLECCHKRGNDDGDEPPAEDRRPFRVERHLSWQSIPEADEFWRDISRQNSMEFQDCLELPPTPNGFGKGKLLKKGPHLLVQAIAEADETVESPENRSTSPDGRTKEQEAEDLKYEDSVEIVTTRVRKAWKARQDAAREEDCTHLLGSEPIMGGPELNEWTELPVVRRMLRAGAGNVDQASDTLLKAIECRVRERTLFRRLWCEVVCDARVIGRDICSRPVVYICSRSQTAPLDEMASQLFLAMEAAVLLSRGDGQVALVADMFKFKTSLNMDATSLKRIADTFSSVFAERFNVIMIVDFSFLAQGIWAILKPMVSEKTRRKMHFIGEAKARQEVEERFAPATRDRILASFDINRDPASTEQDRHQHALKTCICNVPIASDPLVQLDG
mmetsp:Transcript_74003/g.216803  ORF Transcript_74003/g.216803 Transcript_74003/m.216803 type:complete len:391 (+) Transcript_74003:80-1252(+)